MNSSSPSAARRASARVVVLAAVVDLALVLLFVAIGRRSHDEGDALSGFAVTAWPFVVGAAVGWTASLGWRRPLAVWPTGVVVWLAAVVLGMLLRVASGQGVQLSFVIVTAIVLGVFLVGWRAIAALVRRLRARRG
ncbi:DUF3054 domain-containing protein [Herbiconiux sp. VKM Ac-2851]|uniref:DUF3054 domain-containing protein n=1 Tax=Herbiconiux sp. VKM Ac-2851 TaxID=2739025 RepID=UPI001567A1D2|nr:DUF3054 domain-containing protein [Herbiconiux sp. VKM Ac-2851]